MSVPIVSVPIVSIVFKRKVALSGPAKSRSQRTLKKPSLLNYSLVIAISFIISHWLHAEADARSYFPITHLARFYPLTAPARFESKAQYSQNEFSQQFLKFKSEIKTNQWDCHPSNNKFNLLIILVDSMRFDLLNNEVMPNLFQFSKKHIRVSAKL